MTREVWFQLVDRQGEALTSADCLDCDHNAKVFRLRDAVKEKYKDSHLAGIAPSDLTVYANTNGAKQKLEADSPIGARGGSKKYALLVEVPQRRQQPQRPVVEMPRVDWTAIPCAQVVVDDADTLIELSAACIHGTGIGCPGQSLTLYRRPALVKQWNEMSRCSIQTYAILWVVGPPGTGKSCAALAFACALNRSHWEVLWIHYSRSDKLFNCVWLHENEKTFCVIKEETIERDLPAILNGTSQTRPTIVFLDGYVKSCAAGEKAHLKCKRWHQQDKIKHRLVCVCSMATLGKEFHASDYPPIPTHVNIGNQHCSIISPSADVEMEQRADNDDVEMKANEDDEDVDSEIMFKLDSWQFEEYANAISKPAFFNRVVNMFPKSNNAQAEREKLLEAKYFVAGGSARLMFDVPTVWSM